MISNPLIKNLRGERHRRDVDKCRNNIPNINHIRQNICKYPLQDNRFQKGPVSIGYPFLLQLKI